MDTRLSGGFSSAVLNVKLFNFSKLLGCFSAQQSGLILIFSFQHVIKVHEIVRSIPVEPLHFVKVVGM